MTSGIIKKLLLAPSQSASLLPDIMVPSFQTADGFNDSVTSLPTAAITVSCSSVATAAAAATNGNGSRASSRVSLPGLDWDEQVCRQNHQVKEKLLLCKYTTDRK